MKGNLFKSFEIFRDLGYFNKIYLKQISPTNYQVYLEDKTYKTKIRKSTLNSSNQVIIKNMLVIFYKFQFFKGASFIENMYEEAKEKLLNKVRIQNINDIVNIIEQVEIFCDTHRMMDEIAEYSTMKHVDTVFAEIKSDSYDRFHIPLDYGIGDGGHFYYINYSKDKYIKIHDLIENYLYDTVGINEQLNNTLLLFTL